MFLISNNEELMVMGEESSDVLFILASHPSKGAVEWSNVFASMSPENQELVNDWKSPPKRIMSYDHQEFTDDMDDTDEMGDRQSPPQTQAKPPIAKEEGISRGMQIRSKSSDVPRRWRSWDPDELGQEMAT